jgi:glycosyltransferase involved in cell wall biosynthesis
VRSVVSVVVPAYNGSAFLREALDSAAAQSRPPREIIVVDDASTDRTADVVTTFARTAPVPVRLIRLETNSGGPARPINVGVGAASGEFIAVLDQDDVFEPTKLEDQARVLASDPGLSLVFSWCGLVGGSEHQTWQPEQVKRAHLAVAQPCGAYHRVRGSDALRFLMRYTGHLVGYPAFLFRRRDWERKGGVAERLRIASDLDLTGWLAGQGDFGLIPRIGYRRRVHAANVSHRVTEMHLEAARVKNELLRRHPFLARDGEVRASVRGGYHGLAYRYRQQGRYRDALFFLLSSIRVWGPSGAALSALCKLPLHWLLKRLSLLPAGRHTPADPARPERATAAGGATSLPFAGAGRTAAPDGLAATHGGQR